MTAFSDIFTFSRASSKWVQAANGDLVEVPVDEPAFDYSTGKRALLLEGQGVNVFEHQNDLSGFSSGTRLASLTFDTMIEDTSAGEHYVGQTVDLEVGYPYALSFDYKPVGHRGIGFGFVSEAFDANQRPRISSTGAVYDAALSSDIVVKALDDGWFRVSYNTGEHTSVASTGYLVIQPYTGSSLSYTGDGVSGVQVRNMQVERGTTATSRIPTTSSPVTRAADICYAENLEGLSSGYTVVVKGRLNGVDQDFSRVFTLGDNDNRQYVLWRSGAGFRANIFYEGDQQAVTEVLGGSLGEDFILAFSVGPNFFQAALDGVAGTPTTTVGYTAPNRIALGSSADGVSSKASSLCIYSVELLNKTSTQEELEAFEL